MDSNISFCMLCYAVLYLRLVISEDGNLIVGCTKSPSYAFVINNLHFEGEEFVKLSTKQQQSAIEQK
jgi:hypothetical protein